MKKHLLWVSLLIASTLFTYAQDSRKVLFIGNSYIYTNDLPNMIKTLALGCGDTLDYSQSTPGGYTFQSHLSNSTTMSFINSGGWDNVVLQEQSQLPAFPYSQVQNECFPFAAQLCEAIREVTPNAGIVFFMTWGRRDGDASNCANYPPLCTYEGMDSLLSLRYQEMAEQNHGIISPVGRVWHHLRDEYPTIELYSSDGSHPSLAGSYAAAVTFYTIIFQKSPSCITENLSLDATTAQVIRETVEQVVYDSLGHWYRFNDSVQTIAEQEAIAGLHVRPNPAQDFVEIVLDRKMEHGEVTVTLFDSFGRSLRQFSAAEMPTKINISDYQPGLYLLRVMVNGREVGNSKILKIK